MSLSEIITHLDHSMLGWVFFLAIIYSSWITIKARVRHEDIGAWLKLVRVKRLSLMEVISLIGHLSRIRK